MSFIFASSFDFTPLESPGIYAGDAINRKHQLLIEGGVKAPSFLTGFTAFYIKKCWIRQLQNSNGLNLCLFSNKIEVRGQR
jgi:hypothetical protein